MDYPAWEEILTRHKERTVRRNRTSSIAALENFFQRANEQYKSEETNHRCVTSINSVVSTYISKVLDADKAKLVS